MKQAVALEAMLDEDTCEKPTASKIQVNNPMQTDRSSIDFLQVCGLIRSGTPAIHNLVNPAQASAALDVELIRRQERERIERGLHDDLGGNLTALKMLIELACKQIPSDTTLIQQKMLWHQLIDQAIDSIHRITSNLQPAPLMAGLPAALDWLASEQSRQSSTAYQVHFHATNIDIEPALATALFRVAQECCNNIYKHAQATHFDLYLLETDSTLILEVIDNGIGFAIDQPVGSSGSGLRGMRERITLMGGEFHIASRPGKGTLVRATLAANCHLPLVS